MTVLVEDAFFAGILVVPEAQVARVARSAEQVVTLATLRANLRTRLAPDLNLADSTTVRLALARAAPEVVRSDPWLGPIARRGGRAWTRVVAALDEALSSLAGREDALAVVARGHDDLAGRARLFGSLARAHARVLRAAGLLDPRREAEWVADLVAHAEVDAVAAALASANVQARGIVDWGPSDLALWRVLDASLSRMGGRASIELPVFDRPLDAERERDALDTLIEAVASALDDAPLTVPIVSALGDLGRGAAPSARATAHIEVRQTTGVDAQGDAVAQAVHAAIADGVLPSEIVVALVSDDEGSAREILRALEESDIPVVDARRQRARRSQLVATAEFALEVIDHGCPRVEIALLLRSDYIVGCDGDAEGRGRGVLRNLARALEETPTQAGDTTAARLVATVARSAVGRRGGAELATAASWVGHLLGGYSERATRPHHARSTRSLWHDLGLGRTPMLVQARATGLAARIALADLRARDRDAEAWGLLQQTLTSYEEAATRVGVADESVSLETFRHELSSAFREADPPEDQGSKGPVVVRLVSFTDLVAGAKVVVLADADAESWPDGRMRARLVSTELEERLAAASDPAVRPIVHAVGAQAVARLVLGTRTALRVVVTYRARDDDGGARSPAPVVATLAARGHMSDRVWRSGGTLSSPVSQRDRLLDELLRGRELAPTLAPDAHRKASLELRREEAFGASIMEGHPLAATLPRGEPFRSILTDESGGDARPLSASAVDRLASCVFRGFVSEVLRPRRTEEAHDVADWRETGQLMHTALEEAFRATAALWTTRPRNAEQILAIGLTAVERIIEREAGVSNLARVAVEQVRAGARAVLDWSIADLGWDFAYAEQAFGEHGGWQPVVLDVDGLRVTLRGRIDRVDVGRESGAVRVIDYKTRERSAESHTAAFGTTKFQLAIYARAAETALAGAAGEGLYLATQRLRPGAFPKRQVERWTHAHERVEGVPRFERRILSLVAELRRGDVGVRPFAPASCEQCDFDGVCRKPRFAPAAPMDEVEADEAR